MPFTWGTSIAVGIAITSGPHISSSISGICKIKGTGDFLAGREEQGVVRPGEELMILPTPIASNQCTGKVFKGALPTCGPCKSR